MLSKQLCLGKLCLGKLCQGKLYFGKLFSMQNVSKAKFYLDKMLSRQQAIVGEYELCEMYKHHLLKRGLKSQLDIFF